MTLGFKYYIHDTAQGYSLEMFGPFTEVSVAELSCCWQTARSTLKDRVLTLDLRGVTLIDETARQWLATMAQDGAKYLPENYLLDTVAGLSRAAVATEPSKQSFVGRLFRLGLRPAR